MVHMISVSERVALHLDKFTVAEYDFEAPVEVTQDGVAKALGISRAHASIDLKKLLMDGDVTTALKHIIGHPIKRKTYFLTPKGTGLVENVKKRVRSLEMTTEQIILNPTNKYIDARGADARLRDLEDAVRELRDIIARIEGRI